MGLKVHETGSDLPETATLEVIARELDPEAWRCFDQERRRRPDATPTTQELQATLATATRIVRALERSGRVISADERAARPSQPQEAMQRILVVEDDGLLRELLRVYLTSMGYAVDEARTVGEALTQASRGGYHALLLDLTLAGASGLDLATAIRSGPLPACNVPLIAVTGDDEPGHRDRVLARGFNDFLTKPVSPEILRKSLDRNVPVLPIDDERIDAYTLSILVRDVGRAAVTRFLKRFLLDTGALLRQLVSMDRAAAARALHTLKSTARSFGAWRLALAASEAERAAVSDDAYGQDLALPALQAALDEAETAYQAHGLTDAATPS